MGRCKFLRCRGATTVVISIQVHGVFISCTRERRKKPPRKTTRSTTLWVVFLSFSPYPATGVVNTVAGDFRGRAAGVLADRLRSSQKQARNESSRHGKRRKKNEILLCEASGSEDNVGRGLRSRATRSFSEPRSPKADPS